MSLTIRLSWYSIYRTSIIVCTCIMLGLFQLFPTEVIGGHTYKFMVAVYGCLLAVTTVRIRDDDFRKMIKPLNKIIGIYTVCVLAALINTEVMYGYSVHELCIAVMPFLYVYFAYPLMYVFHVDGGMKKSIATTAKCVMAFLILKGISWVLYSFAGKVIFPQMLFEFGEGWTRNGLQRVNAGYLAGLALVYYITKGFSDKNPDKKKNLYKFFTIYIIFFLFIITAFRFQSIVALTVFLACLYFPESSNRSKTTNRLVIVGFILVFLCSPFFVDLIESFSVNNAELGGSTELRMLTIEHFYPLMKSKNPIIGLGLMIFENPLTESLMRKSEWRLFYLEDIGIIGAWFKLGILIFGIYGRMFYWAAKDLLIKRTVPNVSKTFMIGLVVYMLFSCMFLNIFDLQRAFDVPFYAAIVSYYHHELHKPNTQSPDTIEAA